MGRKGMKNVPDSFKQKHQKNKRNKSELVFDESVREEWLTGFKKRKDERRKLAQRQEIDKLKEEKRELKKKKKDERAAQLAEMRQVVRECKPELEVIAKPKKYELSNHTVTITDVTEVDYVGATGLRLGSNNQEDEEVKEEEGENNNEEEKSQETDEAVDSNRPAGSKKKKRKPHGSKHHKNMSHLMDKRRLVKRLKLTPKIGNKKPGKRKR